MNRLVIFALGVAVGTAATLALQWGSDEAELTADTSPELRPVSSISVAEQPRALRPDIAPVARVPVSVDFTPLPTPSLEEALAEANGDVESLVVVDGMFIGGRASQLLAGDEFSRLVSALSRTASVSAAENYQRLFDEYNALPAVRSGAVIVQSLACGRRVCAASLVGYDSASVDRAWDGLIGPSRGMLMDSTGFEIATGPDVLIGGLKTQGPNGYERRLLITVDPSVQSATTGFQTAHPRRD